MIAVLRKAKSISGVFVIAMTVLALCRDAQGQCEGKWAEGLSALTGVDGSIYAMTVFNDGSGDALYVGGSFSIAGDTPAANIAKWDGSRWSALGSGMSGPNPAVQALSVFDDGGGSALYVGGEFTTAGGVSANNIAKWDGSTWSALGLGVNMTKYTSNVNTLTVFDDGGGPALYAGGDFTTAGGVSAHCIAKWDGSSWSALGSGMTTRSFPYHDDVYALTVFDDGGGPALYAGGEFINAGGMSATSIAKWNGSSWSALGSGMSGPSVYQDTVYALTAFDDGGGPALYAGGVFHTAGGVSAKRIAKWNGSSWSTVGLGIHGPYLFPDVAEIYALTAFDDGSGPALYAGSGYFANPGSSIVKWDGSHWSVLPLGMSRVVAALAVFDDGGGPALYVGGQFTSDGENFSPYFARWSPHAETDAAGFALGMTGPVATPECKPYDYDCDGDVDLQDYARLLFRVGRN